jgi:hypothetical protein
MTQSAQSLGFHVGERENTCSPQSVGFHFPPNAFIWIQLRTVSGQDEQAQISLILSNRFCNFAGFVHGMPIPNQKNRLRSPYHQAVQKAADHVRIQIILFNHKSQATPPFTALIMFNRYRAPVGVCPLSPPGRPRMIIASQPRFIFKPDFGSRLFGFFSNRRIFLLNPLPHQLGFLLVRPPSLVFEVPSIPHASISSHPSFSFP